MQMILSYSNSSPKQTLSICVCMLPNTLNNPLRVFCVGKRIKSYVGMCKCCRASVTKLLFSFEKSVQCAKILTREFSKKHFAEKYENVYQL